MAGSGALPGPAWDQRIASMPTAFSTLVQRGERFMSIKIFMYRRATILAHRSAMQGSVMPA